MSVTFDIHDPIDFTVFIFHHDTTEDAITAAYAQALTEVGPARTGVYWTLVNRSILSRFKGRVATLKRIKRRAWATYTTQNGHNNPIN